MEKISALDERAGSYAVRRSVGRYTSCREKGETGKGRTMKRETRHVPVLLSAVLEALAPRAGAIVVDCTLGLGGHAAAILERISPGGRLVGIDFDPVNIALARKKLAEIPGGEFTLHQNNFAALPTILAEVGVERVDGLVA